MTDQNNTRNTSPLKILVADDELMIATFLASNLEDLGYEVVGPTNNGESVIKLCHEQSPDLALLDIQMPKVDGIEAACRIFKEQNIPTVILSAYADPEYVEAGNKIGIFGYLLKPVTKDQLRVGLEVAWARFIDWSDKRDKVEELQERLEQRKLIEQAKWIVVKRKQVDEPEAMRMLQKQARNNRKPLITVAQAIVDSEDILGD
ncbi:MAG: response regulator [Phycisphaerales bacterium]|nr:response regulator [Phycisphaerales bacterium]